MKKTQKDVAEFLGVSEAFVSQVLYKNDRILELEELLKCACNLIFMHKEGMVSSYEESSEYMALKMIEDCLESCMLALGRKG